MDEDPKRHDDVKGPKLASEDSADWEADPPLGVVEVSGFRGGEGDWMGHKV